MTIVDSIKCALSSLGKPSTSAEIYQEIMDNNLYEFGAKNPQSLVRGKLRTHTLGLNFPSASPNKFFKIHSGEGKNTRYVNLENAVVETVVIPEVTTKKQSIANIILLFFKNRRDRIMENKDAHVVTLHECWWMLFGSFIPIIMDSLFRVWCLKISIWEALSQNIKGGEVFLFTSALITPFFYFLVKNLSSNNKEGEELPYIGWVFTLTILSWLFGLAAFIYYRTGSILAGESDSVLLRNLFSAELGGWAWLIYIVSLLIWYYSAYMNNKSAKTYYKIRRNQIEKLSAAYGEVRG